MFYSDNTDCDASLSSISPPPQQQQQQQQQQHQQEQEQLDSADSLTHGPLQSMEQMGRLVWGLVSRSDSFFTKYGRDISDPGVVHCYLFTRQPRADTFAFEAFAAVCVTSTKKEELVFHPLFEQLIERYTRIRTKPNPVLMETRSTDFCYRLTILVEAVPRAERFRPSALRLVREFAVLQHVWEQFHRELVANQIPADFLVGVPMPFELVNVVGHPEYDLHSLHGMWQRDLRGEEVPLAKWSMPGSSSSGVESTLSYMSVEKVGPTIHYLLELLKSQRRSMSLSSALKIYDQLLCRLMVLHKYGVILGNLDAKFLNFGVREASKVLYINRYDFGVVAPTQHRSFGSYSDRCASIAALRRREVHFVNDIESAFYVLLSLIFPALPWDSAKHLTVDSTSSESLLVNTPAAAMLEEKTNFWGSSLALQRMLCHLNFDFSDSVYQGFTADLLTLLYSRTQEAAAQYSTIPHAEYMSMIMSQGSPSNNAYSSLRRILATYFQFDGLAGISKDPICKRKVELLLLEDPEDKRTLWNLNDWCWNQFYPAYVSNVRTRTVSMIV